MGAWDELNKSAGGQPGKTVEPGSTSVGSGWDALNSSVPKRTFTPPPVKTFGTRELPIQEPKPEAKGLTKIAKDAGGAFFGSLKEQGAAAVQSWKDAFEVFSETPDEKLKFRDRVAYASQQSDKAFGAMLNAGIKTFSLNPEISLSNAGVAGASKIPVLGAPVKAAMGVLNKLNEIVYEGTYKGIEALPINETSKQALAGPLAELTSTITSIVAMKKGGDIAQGITKAGLKGTKLSEPAKANIEGGVGAGVSYSVDPLFTVYRALKSAIMKDAEATLSRGIPVTPETAKDIVNKAVKTTELPDMPATMKVATPEGNIEIKTNQKLVLQNLIKGREDINYKVVKDLSTDLNGNKIASRFEWDHKKQQGTILVTNKTTAVNLAHELGHYVDRKLGATLNQRLSDVLPNYRENRDQVNQVLADYALEKLGGEATKPEIDAEILKIADSLNNEVKIVAARESRQTANEQFATAFADVIDKPGVRDNAPELSRLIDFTVGKDVKRPEAAKIEAVKEPVRETATKSVSNEELKKVSQERVAKELDSLSNTLIEKAKFNKILSADDARELFKEDGYNGLNASAVHDASKKIADNAFTKLLKNPEPDATFLAGGPGSGKSTATTGLFDVKDSAVVFDSTFSSYDGAKAKIEEALAAGKNVRIFLVARDIATAWKEGVIPRMKTEGRALPLEAHIKGHLQAPEVVNRLSKEFPQIDVLAVDNRGARNEAKVVPLDKIAEMRYNREKVTKELYDYTKNNEELTPEQKQAFLEGSSGVQGTKSENGRTVSSGDQTKQGLIASTGLDTGKRVKDRLSYNPDKINAPEDVEALFKQVADASGEFSKQRVSKSDADIQDLARTVGLTPEQLLKAQPGSIANAETVYKSRQMIADMAQDLRDTLRKYETEKATPEQLQEVKVKLMRLQGVMKTVAGFRTEASNVFRQFNLEAKAGENDLLRDLLSDLKKADLDAGDDLEKFTKKSREVLEPTLPDKAWHLWYMSILSGPTTHVKNILGNTASMVGELSRVAATSPAELPAAISGTLDGLTKGFEKAKGILKDGDTSKFEDKGIKPIVFNGVLKPLNLFDYVGRAMAASDAVFREGFKGMELKALAREQALKEGYTGAKLNSRIEELYSSPTDVMEKQAEQFGAYGTFNQKPEGLMGVLANGLSSISTIKPGDKTEIKVGKSAVRLVVPFTRIVANVINAGLDWSPVGLGRAALLKVEGGTPRAAYQEFGRGAMGTLAMAGLMSVAEAGNLSGHGPTDKKRRDQLLATGWRPNSFRVGDTWYSYNNLGPFAIPMSIVGNYHDAAKYSGLKEGDLLSRLTATVMNSANSILDASFLTGLTDLLTAISNPERDPDYLKRFIAQQVSSPLPNFVKQIQRFYDPTSYETNDIKEQIMLNLGLTSGLKPKLNVWGEEIKRDPLSGLSPSKETSDPTTRYLVDNNLFVTVPSKSTNLKLSLKESRPMTEDEYRKYLEVSGKEIKKRLTERLEYIKRLPDEESKQDYIDSVTDEVREQVKQEITFEARKK